MKKILGLLFSVFITLSAYGQSRTDYSLVNNVTQVGDTIVVKFQYFKGNQNGTTTAQFDFKYNNKLLQYISHEWQLPNNTNAQRSRNNWTGYVFNKNSNLSVTDFDGQYTSLINGTANYTTNPDWSIERITVQDAVAIDDESEFVKYSFKIKDKANSNYNTYENLISVNWSNYRDASYNLIDVTGQEDIDLFNIQGGDAGTVNINLFTNVITNQIGDGTDYEYTINIVDANGNQTYVTEGEFDASGQAQVTGLENDQQYSIFISVKSDREFLNEAVTVSDLALIFNEAIGAGTTPGGTEITFDYYLQSFLGNVVGELGPNGVIDFQDSYEVLAYLQGVNTSNQNFITQTNFPYNISGIKSTFGDPNANGYPTWNSTFTPTDSNKNFDFAHALNGDVNFTHGYEPTSANAGRVVQGKMAVSRMNEPLGMKYKGETANLDLVSQLTNGQVIFSINSQVEEMVGSQFNIVYDNTRLVLENVIFDTGNEMTNFSNHIEEDGKIRIGSFDQNFKATVKTGTPYKLIFSPMVELNNTSGLISFKVKEGVKADGTQINFIIE